MIELLVSIAIIGIFAGIFFANYHGANKKSQLVMAAQKLVTDIRLAQNYCLSAKDFNTEAVPGGWGVYFNTTGPVGTNDATYILFADRNENGSYTDNPPASNELYKKIDFPPGITITNVVADDATPNKVSLIFVPPDPTVTVDKGMAGNEIDVTISDTDGNSKTVSVNFLGLIEVN